jgi:hypothetical protein
LTVLKKRPEIRTRFRLEAAYVKANPWKYKKSSIDTCIVFGMATGGSDDKQARKAIICIGIRQQKPQVCVTLTAVTYL